MHGEEVKLSSFGTFSVQSKKRACRSKPENWVSKLRYNPAQGAVVSSFTYPRAIAWTAAKMSTKADDALKAISRVSLHYLMFRLLFCGVRFWEGSKFVSLSPFKAQWWSVGITGAR